MSDKKDEKQNNLLSLPEKERQAVKKVIEYKLSAESNIVSILFKQPDLCYTYNKLTINDFSYNAWKVYFTIVTDLVIKEGKNIVDEVTIGLYLEKHEKLSKKYAEYGGWETIEKAMAYVEVENMDGYIEELEKWNTVLRLAKNNFPIADKLKSFVDMTLQEIYGMYEGGLNDIFINVSNNNDKYNKFSDGIYELIDKLNEGLAVGLEYNNMKYLTDITGGSLKGNITLIGAMSNQGKSTFLRNAVLPSIIKNGERLLIMANEEGIMKWQREMLVFVANNIYGKDLQKHTVRNGKYSEETYELLRKCADWIVENTDNLIFVELNSFSTQKCIQIIKRFSSSFNVKYYILDTFKADNDVNSNTSNQQWLDLQQNMVKIYNTIKEGSGTNSHIWITFQLSKSDARLRAYDQNSIGMSKSIIDVCSTCITIRGLYPDEVPDDEGKATRPIKAFNYIGDSKAKQEIKLDNKNKYQLIQILKSREGLANDLCIIAEHNMGKNTLKEVGLCSTPIN